MRGIAGFAPNWRDELARIARGGRQSVTPPLAQTVNPAVSRGAMRQGGVRASSIQGAGSRAHGILCNRGNLRGSVQTC